MLQPATLVPDWTADRRVQLILASLLKHPPRRVQVPPAERWTSQTLAFAGYRVEALQAIWNDVAAPVLERCHLTGDYEPWTEFCMQPTVGQVVDRLTLEGDLELIRSEALATAHAEFHRALAA